MYSLSLISIFQKAFFKFKLFYKENTPAKRRENITIILKPLRGNFKVYATNNLDTGAPNGVNAIWVSSNNHIKIYNDDPNYARTIYLTV